MSYTTFFYILFALFVCRNLIVYGMQYIFSYVFKKRLIYDVPIKEEQRNREKYQPLIGTVIDTLFLALLFLVGGLYFSASNYYQFFLFFLIHIIIVEPIYYWYHRALHIKYLYRKHHRKHHLSLVTTPATSFTFTFLERLSYSILFGIPLIIISQMGLLTVTGMFLYIIIFDLVNMIGHLNHEVFPSRYQASRFWWILYTPTFHSQHHSKFKTNYALFMPIFDKLFNTYELQTKEIFSESCANRPQKSISGKLPKKDSTTQPSN